MSTDSEVDAASAGLVCLSPRRKSSREVAIGGVIIGGGHRVAIQSMTTTPTSDARATAAQVCALARAGCDIVRVTVPSGADARALPEIRRLIGQEGVSVPLVADIHFTPRLALQVVEHVEKVRINPGNYSDKKSLEGKTYDDARWERDAERARELFAPLALRAKELGVALRIGVNHGSLSDRLVHRFGDSPRGMVESALEFIAFAEECGHRDLVLSMKASIPQVMVRAYRLLARRLGERGEIYPLHLGVTEAGGGDDGRVKSAAGIATLLGEGLGDTVRVSLTEDPVHEVPAARELVERFARPVSENDEAEVWEIRETRDALDPRRRRTAGITLQAMEIGGEAVPLVELAARPEQLLRLGELARHSPPLELADIVLDRLPPSQEFLESLGLFPGARAVTLEGAAREALLSDGELRGRMIASVDRVGWHFERVTDARGLASAFAPLALLAIHRVEGPLDRVRAAGIQEFAGRLAGAAPNLSAAVEVERPEDLVPSNRLLAAALDRAGSRIPLVLIDRPREGEDPRLGIAGRLAPLLLDGQGDGVRVAAAAGEEGRLADLAHRILQACRRRLERAEYIACPSCGRTLFDLEETTARVQELTGHLKLKIAVMGCVVNGPGEMADADYGYVGWGEGKVALFVGEEMVEKDIPFAEAPARLVKLIKERGHWTDP